jgi:hypothetical protein
MDDHLPARIYVLLFKDLTSTSMATTRARNDRAGYTGEHTAKESETFDRSFLQRDMLRTYGVLIRWYFRRLETKENVGVSFKKHLLSSYLTCEAVIAESWAPPPVACEVVDQQPNLLVLSANPSRSWIHRLPSSGR